MTRFYYGQTDYIVQLNLLDDAVAAAVIPTYANITTALATTPLSIASGGTGAKTAPLALAALGAVGYAPMTGRTLVAHDFTSYIQVYETKYVNLATSTSVPTHAATGTAGFLFGLGGGDGAVKGVELLVSNVNSGRLAFRDRSLGTWNVVWTEQSLTSLSQLTNGPGYLTAVPIASGSAVGGIKVGSGLSIDGAGVLIATGATTGSVSSVNSITPVTGNVTLTSANIPENTNLYFTAARVLASVLTGLSTATSTVAAAADTVLVAIGKLQAQISGLATSKASLAGANFTGDVDLANNKLSRATFKGCGLAFLDKGTVTTNQSLDYAVAGHQRLQVGAALTISETNWPPAGTLGESLIELVNGAAFAVTWPTTQWIKLSDGSTTTNFSSSGVVLQTAGTDWVLRWTRDGGATVYGKVMR